MLKRLLPCAPSSVTINTQPTSYSAVLRTSRMCTVAGSINCSCCAEPWLSGTVDVSSGWVAAVGRWQQWMGGSSGCSMAAVVVWVAAVAIRWQQWLSGTVVLVVRWQQWLDDGDSFDTVVV